MHELRETAEEWLMADPKTRPDVETLRIQATASDAHFLAAQRLETRRVARDRRLGELLREIQGKRARQTMDYDAMTELYRTIFQYVGLRMDSGEPAGPRTTGLRDDDEAREVAHAVESVFPRTSLQTFLSHGAEERAQQVEELTGIVLGVRLYNWKSADASPPPRDTFGETVEEADRLSDEAQSAAQALRTLTKQYTQVLGAPLTVASALRAREEGITEEAITARLSRWGSELTNRRQLLASMESVVDELEALREKLDPLQEEMDKEMEQVHELLGGRETVPRQEIYPHFYAIGQVWLEVVQLWHAVQVQRNVFTALEPFIAPAVSTLPSDFVQHVRAQERQQGGSTAAPGAEEGPSLGSTSSGIADEESGGRSRTGDEADKEGEEDGEPEENLVRLRLESSPELMHLPLYLQGHCPVLFVRHTGVLVAGDPHLGVLRWGDTYVTCSSEAALAAFEMKPRAIHAQVMEQTRKHPELVHLLGLESYFPELSLSAVVEGRGQVDSAARSPGGDATAKARATRDAGTDTPVHFVEKNIVPGYTFSEWELRRRVLQMANLQQCATTSSQTDSSHFRRDNDSQVYLLRDASVQTAAERGTNPERRHTYVTGLRGGAVPVPPRPSDSPETRSRKQRQLRRDTRTRANIVNLQFDL